MSKKGFYNTKVVKFCCYSHQCSLPTDSSTGGVCAVDQFQLDRGGKSALLLTFWVKSDIFSK